MVQSSTDTRGDGAGKGMVTNESSGGSWAEPLALQT